MILARQCLTLQFFKNGHKRYYYFLDNICYRYILENMTCYKKDQNAFEETWSHLICKTQAGLCNQS